MRHDARQLRNTHLVRHRTATLNLNRRSALRRLRTTKLVREMLPKTHFATVYAKPTGRPMVDTFITEVSQDTWMHFPWYPGL